MTPDISQGPTRRQLLLALGAVSLATRALAVAPREITGVYSDEQMVKVKRLTLPRVLLYDSKARHIDRHQWPAALQDIKKRAGEAFCCISDRPSPHDCKRVVYGEDIQEHFDGLLSSRGSPIRYRDLPAHTYLVVDYFADWCAPCLSAKKALGEFLASPAGAQYVALIVDFSRLPKLKNT